MKKQNKNIIVSSIVLFFVIQFLTALAMIKSLKYDYIYDLIVATILVMIISFVQIKYNLYLKSYINILIIITIISHNLLGQYLNFYVKYNWFDIILHILGTYSFSLCIYSFLSRLFITTLNKILKLIFTILLGTSIGTAFEIFEFLTDKLLKPKIYYQTSLFDTNIDLICNIIGSIIAAFHLSFIGLKSNE